MPDPRVQAQVERLGPWFQNLHLPDGTQTAPGHPLGDFPRRLFDELAPSLPSDLRGWRCLDIGSNAGFYSFELARRGARVRGIDVDPRYLRQARWTAERLGLQGRVRFEQGQVYDLARERTRYDLVLFLGVFYHLRYPLLGLDLAAQKARRMLVFQSLRLPGEEVHAAPADLPMERVGELARPDAPHMAFVEHRLAGDRSNWWVPNLACIEAMRRSAGMEPVQRAGPFHVCRPAAQPAAVADWDRSELLAATGQPWRRAAGAKTRPEEGTLEVPLRAR